MRIILLLLFCDIYTDVTISEYHIYSSSNTSTSFSINIDVKNEGIVGLFI
jgi:hypothetical protein